MTDEIKFIACDMDGTLLDSHHNLPPDFFTVFEKLKDKNIIFAAASGRQYFSLRDTFAQIADDVVFIAENGTFVLFQGEEIFSSVIPVDEVHGIITTARGIKGSHIVLCGKKSAYVENKDDDALKEIKRYYHQCQYVNDLLLVDDDFIKIAVLNFEGSEENIYPVIAPKFGNSHQVVVSAKIWLDVMHREASKGMAIKKLRDFFGFTFEQSMSFGDYFNDIEMLKETHHSYAMSNAHPDIKKVARFSAPSNNDAGVTQIIKHKVLSVGSVL